MAKKTSKKLLEKRKAFLAFFLCFYDVRDVGNKRYEIIERVTDQMISYIVFADRKFTPITTNQIQTAAPR